ncbi:MAG TPA: M36 family metallopeptidase, partial [Blastocatellia bacterium]|nr:M36 family metallopeptidase [Blastocatellia bacterium]
MKRSLLIASILIASLTLAAAVPGVRMLLSFVAMQAQTSASVAPRPRQTGTRRPQEPLENFDIRANLNRSLDTPPHESDNATPQSTTVTEAESAAQELQTEHPRTVIRWSSLTGTPSRITNQAEAITAPSQSDADTVGRRFVRNHARLFRLRAEEVDKLKIKRRDRSARNGVTHLTYEQQVSGIEVFQDHFKVHVDRNGSVLATSGELMPEAERRINRTTPRLNNLAALRAAARFAGVETTINSTPRTESQTAERSVTFGAIPNVASETNGRLVYFPLTAKTLRLAWEFTLWMQDTPDVYLIVVDAERGTLLYRYNCTNYENPHGLVFSGESPRPNAPQITTDPTSVERQDAPFNGAPYFPANDKHFDWWSGQSQTTLISNNTDTHLDRAPANNQPDEPRLTVSDSNFSFPLDFTQAPTTENNQKAALVNVFYWVNRYHDILYGYGFTEAAGNFQTDNFNLGGVGNDAVQADVQDGSGTNNANFSTPPDGRAGRMQMYLWNSGAAQPLDGDLDQGVIIHELTHGLSNRLIGNGGGLGGTQAGGMGEGWSDYLALVLLRKESDDVDGKYAIGQYVRNNYALGIRRYPYSTNKTVNPLTFGNISLSTEVHRVGEIWCLVLWEMRAALIKQYGFTEGQRQSIQLVVDGMKLSPGSPSFLEARDAILLADRTNNNGANQCIIWQAFAKRGMGFSATTTGPTDTAPKEAFDTPAYCNDAGMLTLDRSNYLVGETMRVSLADRNAANPTQVTLSSSVTGDQETLLLSQEASLPGSFKAQMRLASGKAQPGDGLLQASVDAGDQLSISYHDQNTGKGATAQVKLAAAVAREKTLFLDKVESGNQGWFATGNWGIVTNKSASPTHSWTDSPAGNYVGDSNATLTSQAFDFSNLSDITLQFAHSYVTENGFDYAIVEYSTDDGTTWRRAAAFTGSSTNFTQAVLPLPALSNQARARIRFRLQIDPLDNYDGWYVDDIRITGRSANQTIVNPTEQRAPVLTAVTPAFGTLAGGTSVTITGTNFTETSDTSVTFDGIEARSVNVISSTTLIAVTPSQAAGAVNVRIRNKYGEASLHNGFTYYEAGSTAPVPAIGHIFPNSGSTRGGLLITISGTNLTPETVVRVGGQTAIVTYVNPTTLRVVTPVTGTTGAVDVTLSNASSTVTAFNAFTYIAPTPPVVTVLTPAVNQTAFAGGVLGITWNSSDNRGLSRHRVSLFRDTTLVTDLAAELPGDTQSFNWRVPVNQEQVGNYRIRVVATDDEGAETEAFSSNFAVGRAWQGQPSMPTAMRRAMTASDGRALYAIGGHTTTASNSASDIVRRFDPSTNSWSSLTSLPVVLSSGEAVHHNGKIYVPGGQSDTSPIATTYIYDIATNAWSTGANAPIAAMAYAIGTDSSASLIYVTGGLNSSITSIANARAYDIGANSWTPLTPMKTARYSHEAAFIEGKLYVAGGIGIAGALSHSEVYNPATQQWTDIAPLNRPRAQAASTVFKDDLGNPYWLLAGGEDPATGGVLGTVEIYDVRNNWWLLMDEAFNLLTARTQTNGVTVGEYFYVLGGGTGSPTQPVPSSVMERLKLPVSLSSAGASPVLAVPSTQIAVPGYELKFIVSASDLNSS